MFISGFIHGDVFLKKIIIVLFIFFITIFLNNTSGVIGQSGGFTIFLPMIEKNSIPWQSDKFIGLYLPHYLNEENVQKYMPLADQASGGIKHSVLGWFIDIEENTSYNLPTQLEAAWQSGYTSFVNIGTDKNAIDIARGGYDTQLRTLAKAYSNWVNLGGSRRAFFAPFPEMNGGWTKYGVIENVPVTPDHFILAYKHIQTIFELEGVTREDVWWVFAPNGWSELGDEFEKYYPGDDLVDVISFSSYNYGFCRNVREEWRVWASYDLVLSPYVNRMIAMAPLKPIIIAQTGTVGEYSDPDIINYGEKNKWIIDSYNYLSNEPNVMGILYFDFNKLNLGDCDFRLTQVEPVFGGYSQALVGSNFRYLSTEKLTLMGFGR